MRTTTKVEISLAQDERFERELTTQFKDARAVVSVRTVHWWLSDWGNGLMAEGRYRKRDGNWSQVDARCRIEPGELPIRVHDELLRARGELGPTDA
jgi:hypothetical protein